MPIDVAKVEGIELPALDFEYTEKDVILYALGCGVGPEPEDLKFVYENGLQVLPTFGVIPPFPALVSLLGVEGFEVNPLMLLHGEQFIEVRKHPLETRGRLTTKPRVAHIYDKVKGALVEIETESLDEEGDIVYFNVFGAFFRGEGGFGGEKGPPAANEPPERPPDAVFESPTLPQQALIYRLSADINPLHADPRVAALAGYERPILHGLCTAGFAVRAMLKGYAGNDPLAFRSLKVRFTGHVFPGETIVTETWDEGGGSILFRVTTLERGLPAIGNACLELYS